ncbi:MAG: hypothetical protein LUH10_13660 [Tannerellaceae bacterium]|nr:hypothetical protein [Tannerellaceae bacterium]
MKKKSIIPWIIKNILALVVTGTLVYFCINKTTGYDWAYNKFLKSNMDFIQAHPHLTEEQRYELKLGTSYKYLMLLKEHTPEDAVILYPVKEDFFPPGEETPFQGEIYNLSWATRFLYPRKIIFPHQMQQNIFSPDISHIAIVNGRGFERIHNYAGEKFTHGILPVKFNRATP